MRILKEFKDFAMKGNVIDLAVGVIIGSAFGKIVTSLVSDIMMPIIGVLTSGIDIKGLKTSVPSPWDTAKLVDINYGLFIQSAVDFIIIAFCIFIIIRIISKYAPKKEPAPTGPTDIELLTEIRDLLKKKPTK